MQYMLFTFDMNVDKAGSIMAGMLNYLSQLTDCW
jgi:hypothetical protein